MVYKACNSKYMFSKTKYPTTKQTQKNFFVVAFFVPVIQKKFFSIQKKFFVVTFFAQVVEKIFFSVIKKFFVVAFFAQAVQKNFFPIKKNIFTTPKNFFVVQKIGDGVQQIDFTSNFKHWFTCFSSMAPGIKITAATRN